MKKLLLFYLCLLVCCVTQVFAQNRTITGTVTAKDDNQPVPGASIIVKGTQIGSVTNAEGKFSVNAPADAKTLVISFVGYDTQEVPISSSEINVTLTSNLKQLSEVVVTGYGTQTRSVTTGSVAQVSTEDLEGKPYTSLDQALQGRVAGLQSVGGSGQPGALQQIRIRGISSITAGSEPLYVVDGIPITTGDLTQTTDNVGINSLAGIDFNDIESVTVLKDASSAAIYGARGANGVILINTKKGKAGKTQINATAEFGQTRASDLRASNKPLTTDQWRTLSLEGLVNSGDTPDEAVDDLNTYFDFDSHSSTNTDWLKLVTRNGQQRQYNVSASGGDEKTQFSLSAGYFKQQGSVMASDFDRFSTAFSVTHKASEKLSFSNNFTLGENGQNAPTNGGAFSNPVGAAYFALPFVAPYNPDGSLNMDPAQFGSNYNPFANAAYNIGNEHQLKAIDALSAVYQILPNFTFTSKVGVDLTTLEENNYWNPIYGDGQGYNGLSSRYYNRIFNYVVTNLLDYHWDVNHDNVWVSNIKVGYEAQKSQAYTTNATETGLPLNTNIKVPSAGSKPLGALGDNTDFSFASILALADISYKGKYVLSGSFRRDGSSRFGSDNIYGNFGSIGAAWNMQEEDFIKNISWISTLKVRGSYGALGNASINNYDALRLYSYGHNYLGGVGSTPTTVGNNDLTWEITKSANVGVDVSLLKDRLSFTFDYYNRQSNNLLLDQPLSETSGFETRINNVGSMRNRGYELSLSGTPLIIDGFRWDASFSISHNNNKILGLIDNKDEVDGLAIRRVGYDSQSFYMRQWAGVDPANGDPLWYTDASRTTTTNDYNTAQQVLSKSASPTYFGSLTSDFSYKGFTLSAMLYYNFGNSIYDIWARYTQGDGYDFFDNHVASQLQRWQKPGDITNVPIFIAGNSNNSSRTSTRFLYSGDYVRLRELTLYYKFPAAVLKALKLPSLRIYVRGTNLATWVKDKNLPYDPEAYVNGQPNFDVYMPKTYTIGLNVGF